MNGTATLTVGDPMPDTRLANHKGDAVTFQSQAVAGSPAVLFLAPQRIESLNQGPVAPLAAAAAEYAASSARLFVVSPAGIESHRQFAHELPPNMQLISDPVRRLLGAFGETATPRLIVLRPNMRIAAILDGPDAVSDALAICRSFTAAEDSPLIAMQAPILLVEHIFSPAFCATLTGLWERSEKSDNRFGNTAATNARVEAAISDPIVNRDIQTYFSGRLLPELAKAFRFQVTAFERHRIIRYGSSRGEQFRHHNDGAAQTRQRAFVLALNLNDDYQGGESMFPEYGHSRYRAPAGAGLIFSSALLHQTRPVSAGYRFTLVTFFSGRSIDFT